MPINWTEYTLSYRRAADILAEQCIRVGRDNDLLIYPIVNLYLQYLELILKEIMLNNHHYLNEEGEIDLDHKIIPTWNKCRSYLERIDEEVIKGDDKKRLETAAIYDSIKKDLESISNLDTDRQSSRYPIDLKGKPITMGRMRITDIKAIVDRLSPQLEGISCGSYEYEYSHEMDLSNDS